MPGQGVAGTAACDSNNAQPGGVEGKPWALALVCVIVRHMTRPLSEVAGRLAEMLGPFRLRRAKPGLLRIALPKGTPRREIREKFWLALAAREVERYRREEPDRQMLAVVSKAADYIAEVSGELSLAVSRTRKSAAGLRSKKETGVDLVQYRAARAVTELGESWKNLAELRDELSRANSEENTTEQDREAFLRQRVAVYAERAEWSQEAIYILLYGPSVERNNSERTIRRLLEGEHAVALDEILNERAEKIEARRLKKGRSRVPKQGAEPPELSD